MTGSISLKNVSGNLLNKQLDLKVEENKGVNWSKGMTSKEFSLGTPQKDQHFVLRADFEFKVGSRSFKYSRKVVYPEDKRNNRYVWIKGKTSRDHLRHSFAFKTSKGYIMEAVNSTSKTLPVDYEGRELYSDVKATYPLVEGSTAEFAYQPDLWRVVPATVIRARNPQSPTVRLKSVRVNGKSEDVSAISDWNQETKLALQLNPSKATVVELELEKEVSINRIFATIDGRRISVKVKAKIGADWITIHENFDSGKLQQMMVLKASQFRFELESKSKTASISELHFFETVALSQSM